MSIDFFVHRLGIDTKKTLQHTRVIRFCDSGGGSDVYGVVQTLKALYVFVNLHSQNTYQQ